MTGLSASGAGDGELLERLAARGDAELAQSRLFTCERTVCSEMKRRFAISSVPRCSSSRSSTSSSRAESAAAIASGHARRRGRRRRGPGRAGGARPRRRARPRRARRRRGTRRSARAARSSAGSRRRRRGSRRAGSPRCRRRSGRRPRSPGAASRSRGSAVRPSIPGIERSSRTRSGCSSAAVDDRLLAVGRLADDVEAVRPQQRDERLAGQRMVVDDEDRGRSCMPLSAASASADKRRCATKAADRATRPGSGARSSSSGLLGASLALLPDAIRRSARRTTCRSCGSCSQTTMALAGLLVALLAGARFSVEGRRARPPARGGFFVIVALVGSRSRSCPALGGGALEPRRALGGARRRHRSARALIAVAPFVARPRRATATARSRTPSLAGGDRARRRLVAPARARRRAAGARPRRRDAAAVLPRPAARAAGAPRPRRRRRLGRALPRTRRRPRPLARARLHADALRVAALRLHAAAAAELRRPQGDFLRLLAYGVLLVGVWRAIRFAEFGRAVAEERARVAREIHDGLAQYLFAVSTHAAMLEAGRRSRRSCPQLKEAAAARPAGGALRDPRALVGERHARRSTPRCAATSTFLTADGELEVDLEIDPAIRLAPGRADRDLPDRPGGPRERPQARERDAAPR